MEPQAPSRQVKLVEAQIRRALSGRDISRLDKRVREVLEALFQNLDDARIYSQDYELSETREEQTKNASHAKKWLKKAHANILAASQADLLDAVDVAHLSALLEQVMADMK